MLEEFKTLYSLHRWLRYVSWLGLVCAILFLLLVSGGFPSRDLFLLLQTLPKVPILWKADWVSTLLALVTLSALSLLWLAGWGGLTWGSLVLAHYHWRVYHSKQRREIVEWRPSYSRGPGLSFAVSLPGGQAVREDGLSAVVPRLRLPQKTHTTVSLAPSAPSYELEEVPTRPGPTSGLGRQFSLQPLEVGVGWHAGITRKRNPNEDSLVVLQSTCTYHGQLVPFGLFVVADGMGGHDCGLEASQIAMQSMMHTVLQSIVVGNEMTDEYLTDMLIGGVEWANRAIYQRGSEWDKDMGTTLTAALVVGSKAYIVNVGDSRTYLYRAGERLMQLTRDHSVVAMLVERGEIAPNEVYTHPERNKVYRCLGSGDSLEVDWFVADLRAHDRLLLCSDGLWEMVRDPEIERILRNGGDAARSSDILVQAALCGGGADNVSVIVVGMP